MRKAALAILCTIAPLNTRAQAPDVPFEQDYHEEYPIGAAGAANDVRALAFDNHGALWAATGSGVWVLRHGETHWNAPEGSANLGATLSIAAQSNGTVWIGTWNGLFKAERGTIQATAVTGSAIGAIALDNNTVYAGGPKGVWSSVNGTSFAAVAGSWQTVIRSILPQPGGGLWVGTASGLYRIAKQSSGPNSNRLSHPSDLLSSNVSAIKRLRNGEIAIGSNGGLDLYNANGRVQSFSALNGMPCRTVRSVTDDASNRIWAATKIGVVRYSGGRWSLRNSRRWLRNDDCRDVAIDKDGTAWVATADGVDAIRHRTMTLESKAAYFLEQLRIRHFREPGLCGPAVLDKPGDLSKSFIEDDDNDGEHTGMYLAMESMRYAVTKDPEAREHAKSAFHALMALQCITGTHHFIARSMVRVDAAVQPRHEVDRTFTPEEISEMNRTDPRQKVIAKRWVPSQDGKWLWKRDASSDEVDGHMCGYGTYYDLAADADEKKLVADEVDRLIGGIVDHGFLLTDIDGKGTEWGDWSPASLNGNPNWHEEKAGNSVEIIAFLGVAYHMTQNTKYLNAAKSLLYQHGYKQNMVETIFDTPSERTHIEDELLTIVYPNLFNHLIEPELKSTAALSIQNWHRSCEHEGIPFYDFVYNRYSGKKVDLAPALETLKDWPLSHIEWTVDTSIRDDVHKNLTPGLDDGFVDRILPRSEMGLCMWDQEPFKAVIGNGGQREDRQNDWLLSYWMGRYYGLVGPASH